MAWVAELVQAVQKPVGDRTVMAEIKYYDDAAPALTLHRKTFFFEAQTSGADMLASIRGEGAAARSAHAKAASLAQSNPVGTTWTVP
jgi:hypothetical protein